MKTQRYKIKLSIVTALLLSNTSSFSDIKDIGKNLTSTVHVKLSAYPQDPAETIAPDEGQETASANLVFQYAWDSWFKTGGDIRIDTTGWLEAGMPNSYRWNTGLELFQDDNPKSQVFVINELYATRPIGFVDLVLGRQIQHNTVSVLYPLADRYTPYDYSTDPIAPKAFGIWQARLDAYLGDWQASIAALPIFQPSKTPGYASRWWIVDIEPITGEPVPPGADGQLKKDIPSVSLESAGALATLKTRQQQWDFFTTVYHGYALYPIIRTDSPTPTDYIITSEYAQGFDWSAGLSTTLISLLEIHTEALYHHTYSGKDDDYINALLGCIWRTERFSEWLNCNQTHFIIEYAREKVLQEQDPTLGYASSSQPFRFGQNTLLAECLFDFNNKTSAAIGGSHCFERKNSFMQLRGSHRFSNGIRTQLILDTFFGKDGLYYGDWGKNNRLSLVLEYSF